MLGGPLRCLCQKDSILRAGESTPSLGLLLTGHASLVQEDFWGNRSILAIIQPGQLFAEVLPAFRVRY